LRGEAVEVIQLLAVTSQRKLGEVCRIYIISKYRPCTSHGARHSCTTILLPVHSYTMLIPALYFPRCEVQLYYHPTTGTQLYHATTATQYHASATTATLCSGVVHSTTPRVLCSLGTAVSYYYRWSVTR